MESDLMIAIRDSKTATRPYVLVNPMLAKHLPAAPSLVLEYFKQLGIKVAATCEGERVLVIGFAETATAVGAVVASVLGNAVYVHTTRELPVSASPSHGGFLQGQLVSEFYEEHSHAKNQSLYLQESLKDLFAYDRVVFVEDEITTGKTILNFLKSVGYSGKITVSALVFNGFNESLFAHHDADFVCLQKVGYVKHREFEGLPDPRTGVDIGEYCDKCRSLAVKIAGDIDETDKDDKNILVIGTEEFMYPALILGGELEKTAQSVKSQSTTRSPLMPLDKELYPLHSRNDFASVYDKERLTYLYNLDKYDTIIVLTDAPDANSEGLIRTLQSCGNQTTYFVRVCNAY